MSPGLKRLNSFILVLSNNFAMAVKSKGGAAALKREHTPGALETGRPYNIYTLA
jgi:hypothetical protein